MSECAGEWGIDGEPQGPFGDSLIPDQGQTSEWEMMVEIHAQSEIPPAPTLNIAISQYAFKFGETGLVTFTFSEVPVGFDLSHITAPSAVLSLFGVTGDPLIYTAVFTPTNGVEDATNVITVDAGWTNAFGLPPAGPTNSANYAVDTIVPTVTITSPESSPTAANPIPIVFSLSEASIDFTIASITAGHGALSNFAGSGVAYTCDLTPDGTGQPTVDVLAGAFHDVAGNPNPAAAQFTIIKVFSANYFVSYALGNDANAGTSEATAWKHHPWDLAATGVSDGTVLTAGKIVAFRQETHWGVSLSAAGNPATSIVAAAHPYWGSGGAVLSGSADPSTMTWVADGGSYKATITSAAKVVYNGVVLTYHSGAGNTVALNEWDWAANVLYVNVGENPSIGTLKVSIKQYVLLEQGNKHTYNGLTFELGWGAGTVLVSSIANSVFSSCVFRWGAGANGLYCVSVTTLTISNCVAYGNGVGMNIITGTAADVSGCEIYDSSSNGIVFNQQTGSIHGCIVRNNYNYGIATISCPAGVLVYSNTVYSNGHGYKGHSGAGAGISLINTMVGGLYYRNHVYGNYVGINISISGNGGNKIYYNIVRDNTVNGIDIEAEGNVNPTEIYNNTVIHSPSDQNITPYAGHGIANQVAGKNAKVANNIVVIRQIGSNCQGVEISTEVAGFVYEWIDYNLYFNDSGGITKYGMLAGVMFTSMATWQAALQADAKIFDMAGNPNLGEANAVDGDPLFVNAAANDFHLSAGSPAIGAGINVGLAVDYDGVAVGAPPSIGAFEFVP